MQSILHGNMISIESVTHLNVGYVSIRWVLLLLFCFWGGFFFYTNPELGESVFFCVCVVLVVFFVCLFACFALPFLLLFYCFFFSFFFCF